jgi:hypothetical protein
MRESLLNLMRDSLLMIAFHVAGWDDPANLFGSQGFRLSVDPESQVAAFFADAERKDLLRVEEATEMSSHFFSPTGMTLHS